MHPLTSRNGENAYAYRSQCSRKESGSHTQAQSSGKESSPDQETQSGRPQGSGNAKAQTGVRAFRKEFGAPIMG
jgi:hypothetical protein